MNDINPRAGKVPRFAKVIFFVLGFALTAGSLYAAWSPPPSVTPPTCPSGDPGCDAPVNVGNTFQLKEGNLMVNYPVSGPEAVTGLNVNGNLVVPFGNIGIGPLPVAPSSRLHIYAEPGAGTASIMEKIDFGPFVNRKILFGVTTGATNYIQSTQSADETQYRDVGLNPSGGNVGIGTPSPRGKLDITTTVVAPGTANDALVVGAGNVPYPTAPYGAHSSLVFKGVGTDSRVSIQEGGGFVRQYMNAYKDVTGFQKYQIGGTAATLERTSADVTGGSWSFWGAPNTGVAGDVITWTQAAYIGPNNNIWLSPRGNTTDFTINNSGNTTIGGTLTVTNTVTATNNMTATDFCVAGGGVCLSTVGGGGTIDGTGLANYIPKWTD